MIIDTLLQLDTSIFLFFNGMHTQLLDRLMMILTSRYVWIPLYIAIAAYIFKSFGSKLGGIYILAIAVAIALTDQTCATLIRPMVERLRPSNPANPISSLVLLVDGYRGGSYGFPSCHAANSFALATCAWLLIRRAKVTAFIFGWAILNSYTRLYVGVHYPGDLLVGALIGSAIAVLVCLPILTVQKMHRRDALSEIGRPRFRLQLPQQPFASSVGITFGDMTIAVGLLTVIIVAVYCAVF